MRAINTTLKNALILEPCIIQDNRGTFRETYRESFLKELGIDLWWVQENTSTSKKGVMRGLHFQKVNPQAKLVTCLEGSILDVIVDLRKGSETFGKSETFLLSKQNEKQLFVPAGFAHGFVALEDCTVNYKCSTYWNKGSDGGIQMKDPRFGYPWNVDGEFLMSPKDEELPVFAPDLHFF